MTDDRTSDHRPTDTAREAAEVVRSEERVQVTTHVEEAGRVRIAKRVVTEERVVTVQVRREELVVEELPTAAGQDPLVAGRSGGPAGDRTAAPVVEMLLSEEEVEVTTRVVPRERVRVFVDAVTEQVDVGATVAREVVEVVEAVAVDDLVTP